MRGWTAIAMGLSLLFGSGCIETEDDDAPTTTELDDAALTAGAIPDAEDDAVCDALARRERSCDLDDDDLDCASRFACSKQLWREEVIADVYECVETQPCEIDDPAMACLTAVGGELEPTAIQLDAERALESLDGRCDGMIDVAPGQSDEVYEIIRSCIAAEPTCDGIGTCVVLSLDTLVADVCGQMETI